MLKLYHAPGAVCAQKVRLGLEEKGQPWQSEIVDLGDLEFMQRYRRDLNPNGVVPTLVVDGQVLIESNVILEFLDEVFPEPRLSPDDAVARAHMRVWLSQIDIDVHVAVNALTFGIAMRHRFLRMSESQRNAIYEAIPDPERRWKRRELIEQGVESRLVRVAVQRFMRLFRDMEQALVGRPWLIGAAYTLADLALTPYLVRVDALGLTRVLDQFPQLTRWYQQVQQRPSFATAIERWGVADFKRDSAAEVEQAWPIISAMTRAA